MRAEKFDLFVDTGGTFTDCIARDASGNIIKRKVLSNGSIRGSIRKWTDHKTLIVDEKWELKKDIIAGYSFSLLEEKHPAVQVKKFDPGTHTLTLNQDLPPGHFNKSLSFEITSGDEAPVLGARLITQTSLNQPLPVQSIKLGSTKGTNALLERKGSRPIFFVTKGFKDLLRIRYQQRPDIFARHVEKPEMLYEHVVEVDERIDSKGSVINPIDLGQIKDFLLTLDQKDKSIAMAVALMNAYVNPQHEMAVKNILKESGFQYVSVSSELSGLIKYVPRAETTVVNAYLDQIIDSYIRNIRSNLEPENFHIMNSAGGLVAAPAFCPKESLLSGPAGGVVGAATVGQEEGFNNILSFDMGGTSTDVAWAQTGPARRRHFV